MIRLIAMVLIPGAVGIGLTFLKAHREEIKRLKSWDEEASMEISNLVSNKISNYCENFNNVSEDYEATYTRESRNGPLSPEKRNTLLQDYYLTKHFPFVNNIIYTTNNFEARNFQREPSINILDYLKNSLQDYTFMHKNKFALTPIQEIDDKLIALLIYPIDNANENVDIFKRQYLISVLDVQELLSSNVHSVLQYNKNTNLYLRGSHEKVYEIVLESEFVPSSGLSAGSNYRLHLTKPHRLFSDLDYNISTATESLNLSIIDNTNTKSPWSFIAFTDTGNAWMDSFKKVLDIVWFGFLVAFLIGVGASFYFKKRIIAPIKLLTKDIESLMVSENEGKISKYREDDVIYPLAEAIESLIEFKTEELSNKNVYFLQILNTLDVGVLVVNSKTFEIALKNDYMVNDKFCSILDKQRCYERVYGLDDPCRGCSGIKALKCPNGEPIKKLTKDKHGKEFEIINSGMIHNGKKYIIKLFYDVAKLKEEERKLIEEKKLFETLFNGITDPIALFRVDGKILKSNNEAMRLFDTYKKTDEFVDKMTGFAYVKDEMIKETIKRKCSVEKIISLPVSEAIITTYPVCDSEQEVSMVVFYAEDITQEKKLENLLVLSNQVAHEISNPLQAIKWKIENININIRNCTHREYLMKKNGEILNETERIVFVVKQLSSLSKKEIERKPADLIDIINYSLRNVKELNPALKVETIIDKGNLENVAIICDSHRLQSVFENLFQNSYHALGNNLKDPIITVKIREEENGFYEIIISDNGQGISPELRTKIFDPFFTTKSPKRGMGLGLSICYNFIKEHEGNISLADKNGNGTTFVIELPITVINREGNRT